MTRKKGKGTRLLVFTGRAARLNRVIFWILYTKKLLTTYDVFLEIRRIKGFRHTRPSSVDRRMKALVRQQWITEKGTRRTKKTGSDSYLYELSVRGQSALELDEVNINDFIKTAEEKLLQELIAVLSSFRES